MDALQRDALASLRLTWAPTSDDLWRPQAATHVRGLNEHAVDDVMAAFGDAQRDAESAPLGVVIRGETYHFEIVANESARGLMALAMDGLPIGNGILTVENEAQALARADRNDKDKGGEAAKAALAMELDGKLVDLATPVEVDSSLRFVTRKDPEALELIRHDAAHVLAEAVQELFPGTQVTIGPAIEDGFYYDFARNEPFTPEDFPAIEAKMREIVARNAGFVREV